MPSQVVDEMQKSITKELFSWKSSSFGVQTGSQNCYNSWLSYLKKVYFHLMAQHSDCKIESHICSSDSHVRAHLMLSASGVTCLYRKANQHQLSDPCDVGVRGYETIGCNKLQDMNVASSPFLLSLLERQSYKLNRRERTSAFSC